MRMKSKFKQQFDILSSEGPWYQSIDLGDGDNTIRGTNSRYKWDLTLKENIPQPSPCKVIDIGCNCGYFGYKMLENGFCGIKIIDKTVNGKKYKRPLIVGKNEKRRNNTEDK